MVEVRESKQAARYTDKGTKAEHCSICDHYRRETSDEGHCTVVTGKVAAGGWCRHFVKG